MISSLDAISLCTKGTRHDDNSNTSWLGNALTLRNVSESNSTSVVVESAVGLVAEDISSSSQLLTTADTVVGDPTVCATGNACHYTT